MVELIHRGTPQDPSSPDRAQPRQHEFSEVQLLRQAMNQLDYGLVVVDVDTGAIQFANALARDALEGAADGRGNRQYYYDSVPSSVVNTIHPCIRTSPSVPRRPPPSSPQRMLSSLNLTP